MKMTIINTDVDIDVSDRDKLLSGLSHIRAGIKRDGKMVKHNTGIYFQDIPVNPITDIAVLDHKEAEKLGYFKIDLINNSIYDNIRDEEHLDKMLNTEIDWALFELPEIIEQLVHIHDYVPLVKSLKPKSIEDLAMILAIIRPAKAYLRNKDWKTIRSEVWVKDEEDQYQFKKSHSFAYATTIVVQLNTILESLS